MPLVFRVREIRESFGLTQAELARRAGVRPATLVDLELNRTQSAKLSTLEKIGKALGVSALLLLHEEPDQPASGRRKAKR